MSSELLLASHEVQWRNLIRCGIVVDANSTKNKTNDGTVRKDYRRYWRLYLEIVRGCFYSESRIGFVANWVDITSALPSDETALLPLSIVRSGNEALVLPMTKRNWGCWFTIYDCLREFAIQHSMHSLMMLVTETAQFVEFTDWKHTSLQQKLP